MSTTTKSGQALVLMERAFLSSDECCEDELEICRGMAVFSIEGQKIGHVAAVVVEPTGHVASQLLLVHPCHHPNYRSIPVECIELSAKKEIRTSLSKEAIESLPTWSCNPDLINSVKDERTKGESKW